MNRLQKAFPLQSLLPLTILMPFRIPIGTSSSLGTPTIEISSSSAFFFFNFFINQIKRPTSASAATPPTTAPAMIVLFRPASTASEGAGLAKVLLGGGKGEVVKVGKEYVGETGIDEMGPSVVEESEESVMVAVKVESVGGDCVCVFFLVVSVLEIDWPVEGKEGDTLPDILDGGIKLEGSIELGRSVVEFWNAPGVLLPEFVVGNGAEVVEFPGHGNE